MDTPLDIMDQANRLQGMIETLSLALVKMDESGCYEKLPHTCHQMFLICEFLEHFVKQLMTCENAPG